MTERPQNLRASRVLGWSSGQNTRYAGPARHDDDHNRHHAAEQSAAQRRSSRVGRHYAEPGQELDGRF